MALCALLAFWTGKDTARMDRLFRRSGLMRPKWDEDRGEKTYDLRALPHPSASTEPRPGEWDEVMVVEMREGVALVAPVDDEGLPVER